MSRLSVAIHHEGMPALDVSALVVALFGFVGTWKLLRVCAACQHIGQFIIIISPHY